jgi:lipopolysaccharide/colanic/teichoic acid biosynthesis glycosyltransferase
MTDFVYRHDQVHHALRRSRDVVLASTALIFAAPILLLAASAIYLEDGGPVLFRQRRVGRFERLFTIYKLRTMKKVECGDRVSPTHSRDQRITAVGRILRKTSIDELPQLINVIAGDMTLVGPRPEMPFLLRRYERWQHLRHLATPGMTGIWQVTHRSKIPLHEPAATALDLEYIRSASPGLDLRLMFKTIAVILFPKGAY